MNEEEINDLLKSIYAGSISILNLPTELYSATYLELISGVLDDVGTFSIEEPAFELVTALAENINIFSGVKTYQNIWDTQKLIFDSEGFKRPFSEFLKDARSVYDVYNVNWLKAEFETAITSSRQAAQWLDIEANKDTLPYLMYQTVGDARVRPDHQVLDGITRRVDDPIWNDIYPPNGWLCRCIVVQVDEGIETKLTTKKEKELIDGIPPLFQMNSGKDKFIFKESEHPYFSGKGMPPKVNKVFEIGKKDNFGLETPTVKKLIS